MEVAAQTFASVSSRYTHAKDTSGEGGAAATQSHEIMATAAVDIMQRMSDLNHVASLTVRALRSLVYVVTCDCFNGMQPFLS